MSAKARVVFLVPDLQIGGAERQVVDLVNHLDRARFDAFLFTFGETADLAPMVREGVPIVTEPRRFKLDVRPISRLARLLREERIDLAHCTLQIAFFMAMAAMARCGRRLPVIDAMHTTQNGTRREELADRILYVPLMRAACDRVITVCDSQREFWAAKYPSIAAKMTTVYNGIDLERYRDVLSPGEKMELRRRHGIEEGDLVLGMLAALRPEKNHQAVLATLARLVKTHPRVKLLCVGGAVPGTEDLERRLRREATARGLDGHVRWLGMLPDPRPVVSLFDVSVQFSTAIETFPLALLESLAMGKPVVASRIGGVPEIVDHGRNGLLVPVGDGDALLSALERVAADAQLLRAMSAQARRSVEARFSVREMARRTEEVILSVLHGASGAEAILTG